MSENAEYDSLTDEQLITRYREGDTGVEEYLLVRHKPLVRGIARELYLVGGDHDDLLQEGMLGLLRAVRTYDPGRDASFRSYAATCVRRQMYDAILTAQRKKNSPLNSSVSIHSLEENHVESRMGSADSAENVVLAQDSAEQLKEKILSALSPMEREVLTLYLSGLNYTEIADKMHRPQKSVDNALQRIRAKTHKIVEGLQ